MPTYRNDTDKRITHTDMNYMEWQPGEEKRLSFFVPYEKLGLTLVADEPLVDRSVHHWNISLSPNDPHTLDLPYYEAFELSLYCITGSVCVYFANSNKPVVIRAGESHFSSYNYSYAKCPFLRFTSDSGSVVNVKVEERNVKRKGVI